MQSTLLSLDSIARKFDERSGEELERLTRILEASALLVERTERIVAREDPGIRNSIESLEAALLSLRFIAEDLRTGSGSASRLMNEDELYTTILATSQYLEKAAGKLNEALDRVNSLASNTDRLITDAGSIVSQASGLTVEVDSSAKYGLMRGSMDINASVVLLPAKGDRWYRFGVNNGDSFDLEIARRFGIFTLRGGFLQGEFGVGLSIDPLHWLSVSTQISDFYNTEGPNLQAGIRLYPFYDPDSNRPWNWLYFDGGMLRLLDSGRDFYLGAGLRFTDDEVRSLVGLVPYAIK